MMQQHGNAAKNTHSVVLREVTARTNAGKLVDVPCGDGALSRRFGDEGFEVIGVDISPPPADDRCRFRAADIGDKLPFADESFDVAVSVEGIEHLERPFDLVRELHRVLRSNGLLVITTPNVSSLRSRWRWLLTGFHHKAKYALDEDNPSPMHHINMLSYHELRYMLHSNGFRIETATTNRIKPINWLYLPLVPVVYCASKLSIARARPSEIDRPLSNAVLAAMLKPALLFGEIMILVARKRHS